MARLNRDGIKNLSRDFFHALLHLAALLIAAGKAGWLNAWVCIGLGLIFQAANTGVLLRFNPQLLNQRGRLIQADTKTFDKVFVALYLLIGLFASILCGLDAVRYGWSRMAWGWNLAGGAVFIVSCIFGAWAMAVNAHFEATVVIQSGQRVCDSGPYRLVRHPGYAAAILGAPGYPLILGSWWGLAPVAALMALFVARTALEDRALSAELPGYREYAQSTRYRLIPGVW
jgi:protein-S-isoprenylcysteine O-methyltransferase Ste14